MSRSRVRVTFPAPKKTVRGLSFFIHCESNGISSHFSVIFLSYKKLNPKILNELIEKIVVSEKEIIDGEKYQCVHIYYKFVGLMIV